MKSFHPIFVKYFVQPQIHSTSEIVDKCATALVHRESTAIIPSVIDTKTNLSLIKSDDKARIVRNFLIDKMDFLSIRLIAEKLGNLFQTGRRQRIRK